MRKFYFGFQMEKALSRARFMAGTYGSADEAIAANEGVAGVPVLHTNGTYTFDAGADGQAAYYAQQGSDRADEQLAISGEIAEGQLVISQQQQDIANEQWALYKEIYEPVEKAWADAALAGLPADQFVTRAVADVEQSFTSQKGQMQRELARYGIDPSSPEYAGVTANLDIAEAAAKAGAATNTRMAINDVNYSRMSDVVKTGRGVPTESASTLAGASNSAAQASGTYATGYNAVAQANASLSSMYQNEYLANEANKAGTEAAMYGAIGTLVGTGAGTAIGAAAACWIAREVYGIENPKWKKFREWMLYRGPRWFRAFYLRHGPAVAAWLRGRDTIKAAIRFWMDRIILEDSRRTA